MTYDIEILDIQLRKTEAGTRLVKVYNEHVDEVFFLVGHHRQVMVTWQRNHGPAFISSFLETNITPDTLLKKEINGVTVYALVRRMAAALQEAGSPALRKVISDHIAAILEWTEACNSINDVLKKLKELSALPLETSLN